MQLAVGKLTLGLESDARIFVGSDAPGPAILAAATLDAALTPRWALTAFVGTNIVDKPSLARGMAMASALMSFAPSKATSRWLRVGSAPISLMTFISTWVP